MADDTRWWETGFFGLHFDLHAHAQDTELGAELSPEHLRVQLEKVAPDFVQCDGKGHPGYTSYPTTVGTPSPGIVQDALRIHREVTRQLGIPLSVHYSGIRDARAVELHPEWAALDADGNPVESRPGLADVVCPRGPYLDELMIPQLREIVDRYDVDGFWVDGDNWGVRDCYCARCRAAFRQFAGNDEPPRSPEEPGWDDWRRVQRDGFLNYVRRYANAVHNRKPDCAVCSNWMYSLRQPGPILAPVDYLSGDFTASFGCERAEMEGRFLDGHGVPWNLMAWAFCSPAQGDMPYQMKTVTHLRQEAAEVMASGGGVFVYSQPQRSGWLPTWHMDMFAKVAAFCRERQPWVQGTRSIPEAAVLVSDEHIWKHSPYPFCLGDGYHSLEGALHVLIENQVHADVLDTGRLSERLKHYGLVVIGEQDLVRGQLLRELESYAHFGGTVIMTGAQVADLCGPLLGVEPVGPPRAERWYLRVGEEAVAVAGPWRQVRGEGVETLFRVYRDRQPGKDATPWPAVTVRRVGEGAIVGIHGAVMRTYFATHHPRLRLFLRDLLARLQWRQRCHVEAVSNVEVSLRQGRDHYLLHLVNRAVNPTLTPRQHVVEQVPPCGPVDIRLRLEEAPETVVLQPGDREPSWRWEDGWLIVHLDWVHIHDIVVVTPA